MKHLWLISQSLLCTETLGKYLLVNVAIGSWLWKREYFCHSYGHNCPTMHCILLCSCPLTWTNMHAHACCSFASLHLFILVNVIFFLGISNNLERLEQNQYSELRWPHWGCHLTPYLKKKLFGGSLFTNATAPGTRLYLTDSIKMGRFHNSALLAQQ